LKSLRRGRNQLPKSFSRLHRAMIRVYDEAGSVIETHEQAGEFKEW
jgi:ribulose-5-phosphate 4-epimerase/fuculose-1-phosphate aldolase